MASFAGLFGGFRIGYYSGQQTRIGEVPVNRVYEVADLVVDEAGGSPDHDSLIELITTSIAPESWDEVGGLGSVSVYGPGDALVVYQTPAVQEQVTELLEQLRTTRQKPVSKTAEP